jgi:hypothetical protein
VKRSAREQPAGDGGEQRHQQHGVDRAERPESRHQQQAAQRGAGQVEEVERLISRVQAAIASVMTQPAKKKGSAAAP